MVLNKKRLLRIVKQKKFVKEYIANGGNGMAAALVAYNTTSENTAAVIAHRNLERLDVSALMDKHGLTDEKLLSVLEEGLEASKTVSTISQKEATSETVDFVDVPDFPTRHKYLETALKLKGHVGDRLKLAVEQEQGENKTTILLDLPIG